jgi:hypothetical protein
MLIVIEVVWVIRVQLICVGTRWRMGGEVKGKLANGVGNQYSSHYLGTWCIQHYYRWCAHLGCQWSTELMPPADLNGLVCFAERWNLVFVHVPSHFTCSLYHVVCSLKILITTCQSARFCNQTTIWNSPPLTLPVYDLKWLLMCLWGWISERRA